MIKGVSIEDWSFIFETQDPEYDRKLSKIIDLYFKNMELEIQKIKNPLSKFRRVSQVNYYRNFVRRQGRFDDTWMTEIPTYGLYRRQKKKKKTGKKILIKDQIRYFTDMLSLIGALDDLDEFLDAKRICSNKEKSYYFGKLYLAAYSAQIKRRKSKGIGKLKKEMLYGSAPSAEELIIEEMNESMDEKLIQLMTREIK